MRSAESPTPERRVPLRAPAFDVVTRHVTCTRLGVLSRLRFLAVLLFLLLAREARATDTWSDPFAGVKRLHRQTSSQNINALVVDLCTPGVSLRGTASGERKKKTSAFGAAVGAQAAINGDFFSYADFSTDGPAGHDGQVWGGSDHGYVAPLAFGPNRAEIYPHEAGGGPEAWARELVSGHPTVLWGGAPRDNNGDSLCTARHPRTAVGLSQDRRTLVMIVVDGRKPNRLGYTCDELSALLKELGAWDGMNLDGGGSSTLWLGGSVVSYPSDAGGERTVGNHLALFASGAGPATHCPVPDYRAEFVGSGFAGGTKLALLAGETLTGYLDYKNTGSKPWTAGVTKLGTTEPRDRESAFADASWQSPNRMAVVGQAVAPGEVGRFTFTLRAPSTPGNYVEHFNLVEEMVVWFSDSGGPADSVNFLELEVEALGPPPAGNGGEAGSQGIVGSDAGGTGGAHGGQTTKVIRAGEESGCRVADGPAPTGSWLFWLGLGLTARWRARRLRRPCRGSA